MNQRVKKIIEEVELANSRVVDLIHVGDPVLRQKTQEVSVTEGKEIGKKLASVLSLYERLTGVGGGLAAPQIGIAKSVFVINDRKNKTFTTYINPKIVKRGQTTNLYRESCLSSRAFWGDVERPDSITLEWTDEDGLFHTQEFTTFMARILQHEYDHLEGILCVDKALPGTLEYSGEVKDEKLRSKP